MERSGAVAGSWPDSQRIEVEGARLAVRHRAGRGPTVVFESGLGLPGSLWRSVWEQLPQDWPLLCYDRAGLGDSRADPLPRGALEQAAQLRSLLVAASVEPPYLLVGHSAGAFVVRLLAIEEPRHTAGLVLVDPSQEDDPQGSAVTEAIFDVALRVLARLPLAPLGELLTWLSVRAGGRAARRLELAASLCSSSHLHAVVMENRGHLASVAQVRAARRTHPDPDVPLTVITARTAIARWSRSRRWERRRQRDAALAHGCTRGRHLVAEGSGHLVPLDAPEVVVAALLQVMKP